MEVHILMFGGKRCGKTTVLASMCRETEKALAATALRLTPFDEETKEYLRIAEDAIAGKMSTFDQPLTRVEVDENPSSAEKVCCFRLGGLDTPLYLYIHDIPGEWLEDDHHDYVLELIRKCQVIIIAIDTPFLFSKMTTKGYGVFHEEYNRPELITNFFRQSVSGDDLKERLILFVPLKCERYYHLSRTPELNVYQRDYMQELKDAVIEGYQDLIIYFRSAPGLENSCTLAITPILSAGGIDFIRFRTDDQTGKLVSLYQKPETFTDEERREFTGYSPRFCEQPMIYSLLHILIQQRAMAAQHPSGFFSRHRGGNNQLMDTAIETLRNKIKRNYGPFTDEGYYIIQNPRDI